MNLLNIPIKDIEAAIARKSFWNFCKAINPEFYKDSRPHLKTICDTLENFYSDKLLKPDGSPYSKLMINIPPRHGKSYTLTLFAAYILGVDVTNQIFTVCYNETLSGRFSKAVRNLIDTVSIDSKKLVYPDIFPSTKIKKGDASYQLWAIEGQPLSYLGTSLTGTITGVGANIGIIDDPVKNYKEAFNDRALEDIIEFYKNTYLSRLEEGSKNIVNMTRWAKKDLCGYLLDQEPQDWHVLKMEVFDGEEMLCPELMSRETYEDKRKMMDETILRANYHQEPMDLKNSLYSELKTYNHFPTDDKGREQPSLIRCYVDTADEGKDFLCAIWFKEFDGNIYIIDTLYTQDPMERTEPLLAAKLIQNKTDQCYIESNNGGRGFARAVQQLLLKKQHKSCKIVPFRQSSNKLARIKTQAQWLALHCYFPEDFKNKWRKFYVDLTAFSLESKNKNDDAPDCLTGCAEWSRKMIG